MKMFGYDKHTKLKYICHIHQYIMQLVTKASTFNGLSMFKTHKERRECWRGREEVKQQPVPRGNRGRQGVWLQDEQLPPWERVSGRPTVAPQPHSACSAPTEPPLHHQEAASHEHIEDTDIY